MDPGCVKKGTMPLFRLSLAFLTGILAAEKLPGVNGSLKLLAGGISLAAAFPEKPLLDRFPAYQKLRKFPRLPISC